MFKGEIMTNLRKIFRCRLSFSFGCLDSRKFGVIANGRLKAVLLFHLVSKSVNGVKDHAYV
jgi:hypothetical protein